jgi:hypothetical protein
LRQIFPAACFPAEGNPGMRTVLPTLAILLASAPAAFAVTDAELKTKIVGTWGDNPTCAEGVLVFNADGTFVSRATGGADAADELKGTYEISGGKLNGKAEDHDMPEMTVSFDGETLVMASSGNVDRLNRCPKP